jgi:hypothetical protein
MPRAEPVNYSAKYSEASISLVYTVDSYRFGDNRKLYEAQIRALHSGRLPAGPRVSDCSCYPTARNNWRSGNGSRAPRYEL